MVNLLATRTGGAYIPPGRLKLMQEEITDKNSKEFQRIAWEALKKSINGLINKVNTSNVTIIVRELMRENLIRGRGLLIRSILTAQSFSTTYTNVYACLIAIINTKFPQIGELLLKRLVSQFKKAYKRNDKAQCLVTSKFIAHLVNQQVAHEIVALEILTLLLENVTSDSVEVAVAFMKEVGCKLQKISPQGFMAIFESLRTIIQESQVDPRIQYMIEVLYEIRKTKFSTFPSIIEELDVINEDEQITHLITLDEELNTEETLNVFKFDENYEENENKYKEIVCDILDEESSDEDGEGDDEDEESGEDEESDRDEEGGEERMEIIDNTETNLVNLRRVIYLTIQSSLSFEEAAHKILKLQLKSSQLDIIANMILDCCTQQRTYLGFYGLLGQRFCELNHEITRHFEQIFETCYNTIQRLEGIKLRNVARFFAHLLVTDSISWTVLRCIVLSEDETCSASRVFIKILIQGLHEIMGIRKLIERFSDETLAESFRGLFPKDNPQNTRFAVNYFTSIGLGQLTDDLRNHLNSN